MALIAISGKMGAGKDTIGKMIQLIDAGYTNGEALVAIVENDIIEGQSDWQIKKMGYKLKQIASILLNVPVEKFEDQEYKKQSLGDEWKCYWYKTNPYTTQLTMDEEVARMEGKYGKGERIMTPRLLLQLLGTECGREILHPHIWSNALFAEYKSKEISTGITFNDDEFKKKVYPNWIITDIRFPNEAQAVKDHGGLLIRINRPIKKRQKGSSKANARLHLKNAHPSETGLDLWKDWDYIINNNGTLEDLLEKVKLIYEEINE